MKRTLTKLSGIALILLRAKIIYANYSQSP